MPHRFTIPDFVILNPGQTDPRPLPVRVPVARRDPGVGVLGPLGFVFDPKRPLFEIPGVPRGPVTNPFGIPGFGGTTTRLPQGGDAVFRRGLGPRLSGIGAILIFGLEIIIREANRDLDRKVFEELAGQKALEERAARVRARDRDIRTIEQTADLPTINPDAPDLPELPDVISPVFLPDLLPIPQSRPHNIPDPQPFPNEINFPGTSQPTVSPEITVPGPLVIPNPVALPAPVTAPQPNPGQFESPHPFGIPAPAPAPRPFPLPFEFPQPSPLTTFEPQSVPSPDVGPIPDFSTQIDPSPLSRTSPFASPQAAPTSPLDASQCKPRVCEDELDEPRVECFKGLYREGVLDTDFTAWAEIDCLTGKEL